MKIKVNHNFKLSDIVKSSPEKSLFDRLKEVGSKIMTVPGMIGQGTKVHAFIIEYIDTDNGIGICSVYSLCGSAKWNSYIKPIFDDEFVVNCKKCLR